MKFSLILVILIILSSFLYVQINKQVYVDRVMDYLVEEKGYEQKDIKDINGIWGKKLPSFYVTVVFENEADVTYTYFAHNDVMQFEYEAHGEVTSVQSPNMDLINLDDAR